MQNQLTQNLMIDIVIRATMIMFYPIYLIIMFIDIIFIKLKDFSDFKEVIVFPFKKW